MHFENPGKSHEIDNITQLQNSEDAKLGFLRSSGTASFAVPETADNPDFELFYEQNIFLAESSGSMMRFAHQLFGPSEMENETKLQTNRVSTQEQE